jgi:hypothetical protein
MRPLLDLTYIDPLPRVSGKRANSARDIIARERAREAYAAYQTDRAVRRDAELSIQMENREARLRPVTGVTLHVINKRFVEVPTRREFPYGPVVTVTKNGQKKSWTARLKAAMTLLLTLKVVARVFGKQSSWLDDVTKPKSRYDVAREQASVRRASNYIRHTMPRRGGQRGA